MSVIPITAGVGMFLFDSKVRPYLGIEGGMTYRKYENFNRYNDNRFDWGVIVFIPNVGVFVPLSPNIVLEANVKIQIEYHNVKFDNINSMKYYGINLGIAYLLP